MLILTALCFGLPSLASGHGIRFLCWPRSGPFMEEVFFVVERDRRMPTSPPLPGTSPGPIHAAAVVVVFLALAARREGRTLFLPSEADWMRAFSPLPRAPFFPV